MTAPEPRRFLDSAGAAGELLRSALDDGPPPSLEAKLLALRPPPPPPKFSPAWKWPWLVGGVTVVSVSAWLLLRPTSEVPRPTPTVTTPIGSAVALREPPSPATNVASSSVEPPAASASPPASQALPALTADARRTKEAGPTPTEDSVAAEMRLLDTARKQIAEGQPQAALGTLDRYRAGHPMGVLSQEAAVVRIEALLASGRRDEARALARTFFDEHPASPHAQRLRSLLLDEP